METLGHAYAYMRMCMHAQALRAHASYTRAHTRACMHMLGSRNYERKVFLHLKLGFGTNPTSFGSHSKTLFFYYKKPYMVLFQNT